MKRIRWIALLSTAFILVLAACSTGSNTTTKGAAVKQFSLYAADLEQTLSKDETLYSWGYGLWDEQNQKPVSPPSIPGPEIRVTEGDHVKLIFHNQQMEPHTIHLHGIDNSFEGDGTPGISQEETKEGQAFTYEFDAKQAGTYFYHCHVEPDRHPEMGLYGAIIVEPKKKPKYDGETVLMLAERDPALSAAEGTEEGKFVGTAAKDVKLEGEYDTIDRHPVFFTINGKTDPDIAPLKVKKDGKYLIRVINAGSDVHSMHFHGHHLKVVATDGRTLQEPYEKDTIEVAPGERYDLVLTADNPGIWPIHCHMGPHGAHGMHMLLQYEGFDGHSMHHGEEKAGTSAIRSGVETMLAGAAQLETAIAAKDTAKVKETSRQLWDTWTDFEDEVKAKDAALYGKMEQSLMPIVAGAKRDDLADNLSVLSGLIPSLKEQLMQIAKLDEGNS